MSSNRTVQKTHMQKQVLYVVNDLNNPIWKNS